MSANQCGICPAQHDWGTGRSKQRRINTGGRQQHSESMITDKLQCGLHDICDGICDWVRIHPTERTCLFKKILLGELGYTDGQGVYNSVRSTEAAIRQIQATILANTLDAVRYEDLRGDWETHVKTRGLDARHIAKRYGEYSEAEAVRVAEQIFSTWKQTLQTALIDLIRGVNACFSSTEPDGTASFSKYIDWICCLGMVPLIRNEHCKSSSFRRHLHDTAGCLNEDVGSDNVVTTELCDRLLVADSVLERGRQVAAELANKVDAVTILDYDRAIIFYNFKKREVFVKDSVTGQRGECMVVWQPLWKDGTVIFDSPLQRLHREVMMCHDLREHARVCQLLNTAPVKVLLGRKPEEERGIVGAQKAVEKALGAQEDAAAGSAASRLVKLIINLKGMRHVGDITDTVRAYLDETAGHLLDDTSVDTSQAGFGKAFGRGNQANASGQFETTGAVRVHEAFRTSVINSINGLLESYVNNLFKTIEGLKETNGELASRLRTSEENLAKARMAAIDSATNSSGNSLQIGGIETMPRGLPVMSDTPGTITTFIRDLGHEVIDLSGRMGDDAYVANSFQSRYIPSYADELRRLSSLWEQELVRCFKMNRTTNNQGQEVALSYSNSAITLLVAPYFFSVLRVRRLGFVVTNQEAYRSEEELCVSILKKTRLETYLADLFALFVADVKREIAISNIAREEALFESGAVSVKRKGFAEDGYEPERMYHGRRYSSGSEDYELRDKPSSGGQRNVKRARQARSEWERKARDTRRRYKLAGDTASNVRSTRGTRHPYAVYRRLSHESEGK